MEMSEREYHIKVLENLLSHYKAREQCEGYYDSTLKDNVEALKYAISSIKTDEAYQIMYEGGEITKDEIKILSTDEAAQIVGMRTIESVYYWARFFKELKDAGLSICKINALKEKENGTNS